MATKADMGGLSDVLQDVFHVIMERKSSMRDSSYVASLFAKGEDAILKKIAEEAGEVIIAAKGVDKDALVHEIVDLWFHCMVLMANKDTQMDEIADEFKTRIGISGLVEKASRKEDC